MTSTVALNGRALFHRNDVAYDTLDTENSGPWYAWMLFTWFVNQMVPETFATNQNAIVVEFDVPAQGWVTERYKTARIMHPPINSDETILIQADDMRLYPIWDEAMRQVVSGNIHQH